MHDGTESSCGRLNKLTICKYWTVEARSTFRPVEQSISIPHIDTDTVRAQ